MKKNFKVVYIGIHTCLNDLRNRETDLILPKREKEFLKRSFKYSGTIHWNNLSN